MNNVLEPLQSRGDNPLLSRRSLMVSIGLVTVLLILVLIDIFYIQFPLVTRTGDAQLQRWIGPDAVKVAGILFALLFGAGYLLAAIGGTRELESARAWKLGACVGAGAGVIVLLLYLITSLNPTALDQLQIPILTLYGSALLGTLVVGFLAAKSAGMISSGPIAGFWLGVLLALVAGVSVLLRDMLFAQHLAATVWLSDIPSDPLCRGVKGTVLMACEVGDDVGFSANTLLLLPLLGLILGTIGGVLGRLFVRQRTAPPARRNMALLAPLICMGCLLIVFIAEAIWNLW